MQRHNYCTSSSSRRCSRVPRCRSSASRWATLRRTSPGHWTDFLSRRTTGRTSSFPRSVSFRERRRCALERTSKRNTNPKLDLTRFALLPPSGSLWHQKSDGRCTRDYSRLLTPGYYPRDRREIAVRGFHPAEADLVGEPDRPLRASIL